MSKKLIFSIFFVLISTITGFSQPNWSKLYGHAGQDSAVAISVNSTNMLFVTGATNPTGSNSDVVTIRYNPATGDTMWVKMIKGSANLSDYPTAITSDNAFVYVTGWLFNPGRDMFVAKYNALTGDTLWMRTYNGSGNGGDYSFAVQTDAAGNVYMAGRSDIGGSQKCTILKYNAAGVLASGFPFIYTGPLSTALDEVHSMKIDAAGNIYTTGKSGPAGLEDYLTLKVNSAGVLQWAKKYNGNTNTSDIPVSLVLTVLMYL